MKKPHWNKKQKKKKNNQYFEMPNEQKGGRDKTTKISVPRLWQLKKEKRNFQGTPRILKQHSDLF